MTSFAFVSRDVDGIQFAPTPRITADAHWVRPIEISVIVPTYNEAAKFERLLDGIALALKRVSSRRYVPIRLAAFGLVTCAAIVTVFSLRWR